MSILQFLAEWALRSSILIACGALLLKVLRVKDAAIRLAAWTVLLGGSLATPAISVLFPTVPFVIDRMPEGIGIRESDRVASPVMLGIARPQIVLPVDWREWESAKLEAVLAHERSHIRRDPLRAVLWHSPLSWVLHRRIVQVAEEASDDAAVAATRDRVFYAEVLLGFMQCF